MALPFYFLSLVFAFLPGAALPDAGDEARFCPVVLWCRSPELDVGVVKAGDVIEHEFKIENLSDQTVWIRVIPIFAGTSLPRILMIPAHGSKGIPVRYSFGHYGSRPFNLKYVVKPVPRPSTVHCPICGFEQCLHTDWEKLDYLWPEDENDSM